MWNISADPVREAKAVALQKLRRFGEARQEISKAEFTAPHAATTALRSFEAAMRYPPLVDLQVLEHLQSTYTFNCLQRRLYRTTPPVAPLPAFRMPSKDEQDSGVPAHMEGVAIPVPPVPIIPQGWPTDGSTLPGIRDKTKSGVTAQGGPNTGAVDDNAWQFQVLEGRLRGAVAEAKRRRRQNWSKPPTAGRMGDGEPVETIA
jgi:hypothetical protein